MTAAHEIRLIAARDAGKLDGDELVIAVCSCGGYQSAPATPSTARKRADAHVTAKDES